MTTLKNAFPKAVSLLLVLAIANPSLAANVPLLASDKTATISSFNKSFGLQPSLGKVIKATEQRPRIIVIQDLHSSAAVQFRIAKMLENVRLWTGGDFKVAVEAAAGTVDSSRMARLPDGKAKEEA